MIGLAEAGQKRFQAGHEHFNRYRDQDHAHDPCHDDAHGLRQHGAKRAGKDQNQSQDRDDSGDHQREGKVMSVGRRGVAVHDQRGDRARTNQHGERHRIEGDVADRLTGLFPFGPVMRSAFRTVQHDKADLTQHQRACDAKRVCRDAKEGQDRSAAYRYDRAHNDAADHHLNGQTAPLSCADVLGEAQKEGQINERVHHSEKRAEHTDCKRVGHYFVPGIRPEPHHGRNGDMCEPRETPAVTDFLISFVVSRLDLVSRVKRSPISQEAN